MDTELSLLKRIAVALETSTEMQVSNEKTVYRRGWRDAVQEIALYLEREATLHKGIASTNTGAVIGFVAKQIRTMTPGVEK